MKFQFLLCGSAIAAATFAVPSRAETVNLDASLQVSCSFVVTDGALAPNSDYTQLSSQNSGGSPAQVVVTALGGSPTITFAAPSITSTNDVSGVTPEISYSSLDGAAQTYTSSESFSTSSDLADIYTVDARAADPGGFDAGDYTITTVVTCSG